MIEKLTQEQKALLPVYRDKWINIGLRTTPMVVEEAIEATELLYACAKLSPPTHYYFAPSPRAAAGVYMKLKNMKKKELQALAWKQGASLLEHRQALQTHLDYQHIKSVEVPSFIFGAMDAGWLSFYDYLLEVCQLECCAPLSGLIKFAQTCGWAIPCEDIIIISDHPTTICRDVEGRLHHEASMAISYADGFGVYAWHGVRVPEKVIVNPDGLTKEEIGRQQNAEVRRVMVERLGIERVCRMFDAKTVDEQGDYALLLLDIGDRRKRPYLKMRNPSIGVYHLEGVHPNIRTVQEALNWRNWLSDSEIDDENGAEWQQQGDVILRPIAEKYKSRPRLLT